MINYMHFDPFKAGIIVTGRFPTGERTSQSWAAHIFFLP